MPNYESLPVPSGRGQRRLKNYLLDRRFQLKYANLAAGIALVISVSLGLLLWTTSETSVAQSRAAVALGGEVLNESRKVSEVVAMNIVRDPEYSSNPALRAAFEADTNETARLLASQQTRLEGHAAMLEKQRTRFAVVLVVALSLLVAILWFGGIMLTHRVAGPIHKMKKQLRGLQYGDWSVPSPLRRGDELTEFFDAFNEMVSNLREQRSGDLAALDAVLASLATYAHDADVQELRALRDRMATVLRNPHPSSMAPSRRPG